MDEKHPQRWLFLGIVDPSAILTVTNTIRSIRTGFNHTQDGSWDPEKNLQTWEGP